MKWDRETLEKVPKHVMNTSDLRTHAQRILAFCAHLLICVPVFAQTYYSPQIRETATIKAYQKLQHASIFNLGGVGFGQTITSEEQAFKTLLESGDSTALFRQLISEANSEGQLYALFGLHLRAPDLFQAEVERLRTNADPPDRIETSTVTRKGEVHVAHGCISFYQDRQTVIDEIAKGEWDAAFKLSSRTLKF